MPVPDLPPLRDYARSRAVLIGNWDYEFLERVPAAANSLRRFEALLTGPLCGWPRDRVTVIANVPDPDGIPDRLVTAYDGVDEVALFYFVGHGQISASDELCLGMTRSRSEPNRRVTTSLGFDDVRAALLDSAAATKIVILDCCYAGLVTTRTLGADDVLNRGLVAGAYTMAATRAYTTARFEETPGLARPQTYFTKYLADVVERGIPGQPSGLRLDPLFRQVRDNLAADHRPVPESRAVDNAREFVFARNVAAARTGFVPPQGLVPAQGSVSAQGKDAPPAPAPVPARPARARFYLGVAAVLVALGGVIAGLAIALSPARASSGGKQAVATGGNHPTASSHATDGRPVSSGNPVSGAAYTELESIPFPQPPDAVAFAPTGTTLAVGTLQDSDGGGSAYVLEAAGGPGIRLHDPSSQGVTSVAFLRNGELATCDRSYNAYVWNVSKQTYRTFTDAEGIDAEAIAVPLDGDIAVSSGNDVWLWNPTTGATSNPSVEGAWADGTMAIAISAKGDAIATADDSDVYLWHQGGQVSEDSLPSGAEGYVTSLAVGPGNADVAIGVEGGPAYMWDTHTGTFTPVTDPSGEGVNSVAFSPSGKLLAVGDVNGSTYVWAVGSYQKPVAIIADPSSQGVTPSQGVTSVAFDSAGSVLATADSNGRVYLWRLTLKTG
jgi:WD40 repeat protein